MIERDTRNIKESCRSLVERLEELCPGTIFEMVSDQMIHLLVPTRAYGASLITGSNVRSGYEPMKVDLTQLGETPETWFHTEISRRIGEDRINPDLITRDEYGEASDLTKPGPDSNQHAGPFFL